MTETKNDGSLFADPTPADRTERRNEYWYWSDDHTLRKMTVTRDAHGRFVDFHYYTPLVIRGEETDAGRRERADSLGELME